jgi:peroxiredoxin
MKPLFFLLLASLIVSACRTPPPADTNSDDIPDTAMDVQPLLIGESIPDITLQNHQNDPINLRDESSENTLFVFYRGGWCPFCSAELAQLSSIEDQLYEMGINIVAVSPDRPEFLRMSMSDVNMDYTLLSDSTMEASKAFGIAFRLDDETYQRYKSNGMDLEERSGLDHHLLPAPAVYLSNNEGIIEFQYVNPDYRQRIDKDVLLAAVTAMLESQDEDM